MNQDIQSIEKIAINALDGIGLTPSESSIITPSSGNAPKQKDIFSSTSSVLDEIGIDKLGKELEKEENGEKKDKVVNSLEPVKNNSILDLTNVIPDISDELKKVTNEDVNNTSEENGDKPEGRSKSSLVKFLKNKIEAGTYAPYGGEDGFDETKEKLEDYLTKLNYTQLEELIDLNQETKEKQIKESYRKEFFESLPGHLKYVAEQLAEGTVDPQTIYASLARVEQVRQLDPSDPADQETIARNYLTVTDFGDAEQIAEQIEEWKEANTLGKRVAAFKPKLDAMEEQQLIAYNQQAEELKKEQEKATQWYAKQIEDSLRKGEVGGIKIDRKKQEQLYNSLLLDIQPSARTGQPMNALWRKLEEMQFTKPDYEFFVEIADHILNREEFMQKIEQKGASNQQSKINKELKTIQGSGANTGQNIQGEEKKRTSGVVKQKYNPFDIASAKR